VSLSGTEAADLLPRVWELARRLGKQLDLIRVDWLTVQPFRGASLRFRAAVRLFRGTDQPFRGTDQPFRGTGLPFRVLSYFENRPP